MKKISSSWIDYIIKNLFFQIQSLKDNYKRKSKKNLH